MPDDVSAANINGPTSTTTEVVGAAGVTVGTPVAKTVSTVDNFGRLVTVTELSMLWLIPDHEVLGGNAFVANPQHVLRDTDCNLQTLLEIFGVVAKRMHVAEDLHNGVILGRFPFHIILLH
jgi:hypothetical protein